MSLFERKPPPRERTREDRERARAEREARRAEREGRPAEEAVPPPLETPPPPDGMATPSPSEPVRVAPPQRPAPSPAAQREPEPVARVAAPPREEPTAAPAPSREQPPAAPAPPRPAAPAFDGDGDGDGDGHVPPPRPVRRSAPAGADAPSSVLGDSPAEDWAAVDASPRVPLGERLRRKRAGAPPPAQARTPAAGRGVMPLVIAAAVALVVLAGGWFLFSIFQPFHGDGTGRVSVVIPKGATINDAGDVMADRGVIASAFFFKLRAKIDGPARIIPGTYVLPKDMSYSDAFDALAKGPPKAPTTSITITEGRTIREANRLLRKTSLTGSYASAVSRARVLRPQQYGAPGGVRTLEGFLFPSTYTVRKGGPVSELVTRQLQNFRKQFASVNLAYARSKKLTAYDVLIIASMIEREAAVAKDRPLIASVIYNRLHQGIPLGIDATLRYKLDDWTHSLRESQLAAPGPYNTRTHQGLPPTPIGNPGLSSIRAAARPAKTSYLYFVVKPCGRGEHAFAKTDAEFQRLATQYEQARQAKGGSPVDC